MPTARRPPVNDTRKEAPRISSTTADRIRFFVMIQRRGKPQQSWEEPTHSLSPQIRSVAPHRSASRHSRHPTRSPSLLPTQSPLPLTPPKALADLDVMGDQPIQNDQHPPAIAVTAQRMSRQTAADMFLAKVEVRAQLPKLLKTAAETQGRAMASPRSGESSRGACHTGQVAPFYLVTNRGDHLWTAPPRS